MMPLSFQGFGFTGIVIMVAVLAVSHLLKYLKKKVDG